VFYLEIRKFDVVFTRPPPPPPREGEVGGDDDSVGDSYMELAPTGGYNAGGGGYGSYIWRRWRLRSRQQWL
jgi:hypothetical protein